MITQQQATIYYAPTKRRRFFTLTAAISSEAKAIIIKRYPNDNGDICLVTGRTLEPSYHIEYDEPERFERMMRSVEYKLKKAYQEAKS